MVGGGKFVSGVGETWTTWRIPPFVMTKCFLVQKIF